MVNVDTEYLRLKEEYERLNAIYCAAVDLLSEIDHMATDAEFLSLKVAAEDARYDLEIARRKLERSIPAEKELSMRLGGG
jgi:hypothetical protein